MRDRIAEMHAARARSAAIKTEQAERQQAEARKLHEAKKAVHYAAVRASYPGGDSAFDRLWHATIEPEWELAQVATGGVAGSIKQLLASGRYGGF